MDAMCKCKKCGASAEDTVDKLLCPQCIDDYNNKFGELEHLASESRRVAGFREKNCERIKFLQEECKKYQDLCEESACKRIKSIKCQNCGKIFEDVSHVFRLCPDCYSDFRFYERMSGELTEALSKFVKSDNYNSIEFDFLRKLVEKYQAVSKHYLERLIKNNDMSDSQYKCNKCGDNYETQFDTILCDKCRNDWRAKTEELSSMQNQSLYVSQYDKKFRAKIDQLYTICDEYKKTYNMHNRERLGL